MTPALINLRIIYRILFDFVKNDVTSFKYISLRHKFRRTYLNLQDNQENEVPVFIPRCCVGCLQLGYVL